MWTPRPRLARAILSRLLPRDVRYDVLQFLDEDLETRTAASPVRARLWYWSQVLAFGARFSGERLRGLRHAVSATDVKLAVRMLVRYPGITLVSTVGMAIGIAIAAGVLSMLAAITNPALPFDEGDRIVAIQNHDTRQNQSLSQMAYDFPHWKASARSVTDIGAYRRLQRNLIEQGRTPETLRVAEMTAAGFRLTRVQPLMGRTLRDEDERPSAPRVLVISEELWRSRLEGDSDILGRSLQLGDTSYTVVGVMPAAFEFPIRDEVWIPWTIDHVPQKPGEGPGIAVFARIAPGFAIDEVRAEFAALGAQSARAVPATHGHVEPRVVPYTRAYVDAGSADNAPLENAVRLFVVMLLAVISINVASLVYARTARRQNEIALRTALGAGRGRIVMQLFLEALGLAVCAAAIGLTGAWLGLRVIDDGFQAQSGEQLAFWIRFGLSPSVVAYTAALALMAAAIVGVVPALKATGRRVQSNLKTVSAGSGGMRLGRVWTFLIVAQVAFAVALLPVAIYNAGEATVYGTATPDEDAAEFLMADLLLEDPAGSSSDAELEQRFVSHYAELTRALEREPQVAAATYSLTNPGGEAMMFVEVEGVPLPEQPPSSVVLEGSSLGYLAKVTRVEPGYFDAYRVEQFAGRRLTAADASPGSSAVLVSRMFVDRFFGGANPLGKRFRYVGRGDVNPNIAELNRWYEIAGVVSNFPDTQALIMNGPHGHTYVYHAAAKPMMGSTVLSIRVRGGAPEAFADRLREVTSAVDPSLQLEDIGTLGQGMAADAAMWKLLAGLLGGLALSVVALSGAGIYAMMSFTVSQRRREIGIRSALGADPRRILTGIFMRAFVQVAIGASIGIAAAFLLDRASQGEALGGQRAIVLPAVALFMTIVGVAAAYGPARHGLRIHPTEALRSE
jgi:putative ABC transport system permease protein